MVNRKISKEKYFLAAIITLAIFIFGLILGFVIDDWRLNFTQQSVKEQEVNYMSLQFQHLILTSLMNDNKSCPVLHTTLNNAVKQLSRSLEEYQSYSEDTTLNAQDYLLVGRRYLLDNLRYWFLAKKSKESCNIDLVNVLYFHSLKDCSSCPDQGTILTYFKKIYGERVLIFPINTDLEEHEPLITILKSWYNITTYPSLVISDEKFEGMLSKDVLGGIICDTFMDKSLCLR